MLTAVDGYLDQVLAANAPVGEYASLIPTPSEDTAEVALVRFVAYLAAFPVVDIGVAAWRCLGRYVADGGRGLGQFLQEGSGWDSVQLEHLLAALHVGSRRKRPGGLHRLAQPERFGGSARDSAAHLLGAGMELG